MRAPATEKQFINSRFQVLSALSNGPLDADAIEESTGLSNMTVRAQVRRLSYENEKHVPLIHQVGEAYNPALNRVVPAWGITVYGEIWLNYHRGLRERDGN